jgi:hypothetical protein
MDGPIKYAKSGEPDTIANKNRTRTIHLSFFTFTCVRIQGWLQHWNRWVPCDSPVISRWLPFRRPLHKWSVRGF